MPTPLVPTHGQLAPDKQFLDLVEKAKSPGPPPLRDLLFQQLPTTFGIPQGIGQQRAQSPSASQTGSLRLPGPVQVGSMKLPVQGGSMNLQAGSMTLPVQAGSVKLPIRKMSPHAEYRLVMPGTQYNPWGAQGGLISVGGQLAITASAYQPVSSDRMDLSMQLELRKLDAASAEVLRLRRIAPGKYEIDGRCVSVYWLEGGANGVLGVCEDNVPVASRPDELPLSQYLQQAAAVASSKVQRRKDRPQPTVEKKGVDTTAAIENDLQQDRISSMLLACKEAGLVRVRIQSGGDSMESEDE